MHQDEQLAINQAGWDAVADAYCGGTALPNYGPLASTEDDLGLLGNLEGARVLELGCGSGHSLAYVAEHGAADVWGIDLSPTQINLAQRTLHEHGFTAHLVHAPMERDGGLPRNYFDLVFSVYALGWTTHLPRTLELVAAYLRPGGSFVFSWEHPAYSCLGYEAGKYVLSRSYSDEGSVYLDSWSGVPIVMQRRKLSTFVNELIKAGLIIDQLIEGDLDRSRARERDEAPDKWYSIPRAQLMPTTFIIKAHKPHESAELESRTVSHDVAVDAF